MTILLQILIGLVALGIILGGIVGIIYILGMGANYLFDNKLETDLEENFESGKWVLISLIFIGGGAYLVGSILYPLLIK
jgi:hypothetical protein